jgi:hypothetical protein
MLHLSCHARASIVNRVWWSASRLHTSSPSIIILPIRSRQHESDAHAIRHIRALLGSPYLRPSIIDMPMNYASDGLNIELWYMLPYHRQTCQRLHLNISYGNLPIDEIHDDLIGGLASLLSADNEQLNDLKLMTLLPTEGHTSAAGIISTLLTNKQVLYPLSPTQQMNENDGKEDVRRSLSISLPSSLIKLQLDPVEANDVIIAALRGAFKRLQVLRLTFGVYTTTTHDIIPFPMDTLQAIVNGSDLVEVSNAAYVCLPFCCSHLCLWTREVSLYLRLNMPVCVCYVILDEC